MMARARGPFLLLPFFLAGGVLVVYSSAITLFPVYRAYALLASSPFGLAGAALLCLGPAAVCHPVRVAGTPGGRG